MKRYFIACLVVLSFYSLGYAEKRIKVTGFVFQEDTTGIRAPIAGLLVKLNRPGEGNTTTSKGYFEIPASVDGYVGEKITFHIERKGWVVKIPANGVYNIPKFPDIIKAEIVLVREGDKSLLNHAQIMAFLYDEVSQLSKSRVEDRDLEFSKLLTEYSKRLKIKESDLQQAIEGWIKNVRTPEEKALAAFHRREFDETINEVNKILQESVNIRKLKADALLAKLDYESAIKEYDIIIHDAPTHADAINSIGETFLNIAKYEEALNHYNRFLPILKIRYSENSPELATGLSNIAGVLWMQGDNAGALEKYGEALRIDEGYWGRNHPNVGRELNNIGLVLESKADYAGALEKFNEAMRIVQSFHGQNHPDFAVTLHNIASVLAAKGDYAGALEKYSEALRIKENHFGRNHPHVASTLNNIAGVLRDKGEYTEALEKYNEALRIDENIFGRNNPEVAKELNNIASVLYAKGDYTGALENLSEALRIVQSIYGQSHHRNAIILGGIAGILKKEGDYNRALEKYNEALRINENSFGKNHPLVASTLDDIANLLESKGNYNEALAKYDSALAILGRFFGADHPNTRTVRDNRNRAYLDSLPLQLRTQKLLERWLAPPEPLSTSDSLSLLNDLGIGYTKQSQADSALLFLRQALPIAERVKEQKMLGALYNNLGKVYKLKQDWLQARQWLEKSLSHNRALAGDSAAVLAYTYFHLAGVAQAEGQTNRSLEYAQKSLALAERHKLAELRVEAEALLKQKR